MLNLSVSCPKADIVPDEHFLRIPVNDTHLEKLLPYFDEAFTFLGMYACMHCVQMVKIIKFINILDNSRQSTRG